MIEVAIASVATIIPIQSAADKAMKETIGELRSAK